MRIFLLFSAESPGLAMQEAAALVSKAVEGNDFYMVAEGKPLNRLQLSRFVGRLIEEASLPRLKAKSFAVKVTSIGGAKIDKAAIIRRVASKVRAKVDLENPERLVHVFSDGKREFITIQLHEYEPKDVVCRQVRARPYFHPTSLQPKYARLLLNLAGLRKGDTVLDPFCGAGGIVLEAGTLGMKATGLDMSEEAYKGCKENLWFFRCDGAVVEKADFLEWEPKRKFDAVVTDLPYGCSSKTFGRERDDLYEKSFAKMRKLAKKAVIMGPRDLTKGLEAAGWTVKFKTAIYAHKSLTRWVHVCS